MVDGEEDGVNQLKIHGSYIHQEAEKSSKYLLVLNFCLLDVLHDVNICQCCVCSAVSVDRSSF